MNAFKDLFLLDPQLTFLNHGSYGATPRPVLEACQEWQRRLERDPVHFINDELMPLLGEARAALGRYLNAGADDLVYIPNATFGLNIIAQSLPLEPGDEVLATDHEYGSVNNIWVDLCHRRRASYVRQAIRFPAPSAEAMLEQLWRAVTPRTRAILVSHLTSSTALPLPVEALFRRARAAGIVTIINGAHAPGQIPLDLAALDADFYVGNCHKWLCSPKGAAFIYTRRALQPLIVPVIMTVSTTTDQGMRHASARLASDGLKCSDSVRITDSENVAENATAAAPTSSSCGRNVAVQATQKKASVPVQSKAWNALRTLLLMRAWKDFTSLRMPESGLRLPSFQIAANSGQDNACGEQSATNRRRPQRSGYLP